MKGLEPNLREWQFEKVFRPVCEAGLSGEGAAASWAARARPEAEAMPLAPGFLLCLSLSSRSRRSLSASSAALLAPWYTTAGTTVNTAHAALWKCPRRNKQSWSESVHKTSSLVFLSLAYARVKVGCFSLKLAALLADDVSNELKGFVLSSPPWKLLK